MEVEEAYLELYMLQPYPGEDYPGFNDLQAYELCADWDCAHTTWITATESERWPLPGACSAAIPEGNAYPSQDRPGFYRVEINYHTVAAWLDDPADNRGLLLIGRGGYDHYRFASSDWPNPSHRPRLVIVWGARWYGPRASLEASPQSCCAPLTVRFTDTSTAGRSPVDQWHLDLGDGQFYRARNPIHTYMAGVYTVTLTVTDAIGCSDRVSMPSYITAHRPPEADFATHSTTDSEPLTVDFSDLSAAGDNPITQWLWDFGDGDGSVLRNPMHTYAAAGPYTVTLAVTDAHGCTAAVARMIRVQGRVHRVYLPMITRN